MARKGIQLCYPYEVKRLLQWRSPYITQPKLDGERCRAVFRQGRWTLLSSEENLIISVPHILRALRNSEIRPREGLELDGELYVHGWHFDEIQSVVSRTRNLHPNYAQLQLHVFDLPSNEAQLIRTVKLDELGALFPDCLKVVPSKLTYSEDEVFEAFQGYCSAGFEGVIVRHADAPYERKRSRYVMKFKPKKTDFYRIVGWKQMVDKNGVLKNAIGAFECVGEDGEKFSVGSGMTDDFRYSSFELAKLGFFNGKYVKVEYQSLNPETRNPRFPIFLEVTDSCPTEINVQSLF